jgi:3-phenylpropionate/cinnamic acid dioxygenase small subunit
MASRYAYAEDPPSRTRRYISNVRVHETGGPGEYFVTSSALVIRNRWDNPTYDLISVERQDILRATDDSYRLARRTVLLDQVTLGTPNMTIFI